jgi:CheY-like chemotaxis protein/HPt (histidine-containing phosphotransfer) domain-containing protein
MGVSDQRIGPQPALSEIDLQHMAVLVVDDNENNRLVLEKMLSNWEMAPVAARDGEGALEILRAAESRGKTFPLALIDSRMPGMDGFQLAQHIRANPKYTAATILMLTSEARSADAARCRQMGIAAYLIKPISQSELFNTIVSVLHDKTNGSPVDDSPNSAAEAATPSQSQPRVLLAEDNLVNQSVAVGLLQKRGCRTTVVGNGEEAALAAENDGPFDLILMDVQMPVMDGFEATRRIRAQESATSRRSRIVAMTAHAMKGDRERCLEVGMDDYISKPVRGKDIDRVLHALDGDGRTSTDAGDSDAAPAAPWDAAAALNHVDDDRELLRQMAAMFEQASVRMIEDLQKAAALGDWTRLELAAHAIKGSVSNFAAQPAYDAAQRTEQLARSQQQTQARDSAAVLAREVVRLRGALEAYSKGTVHG